MSATRIQKKEKRMGKNEWNTVKSYLHGKYHKRLKAFFSWRIMGEDGVNMTRTCIPVQHWETLYPNCTHVTPVFALTPGF